ncbi:hypothetical protein pipiens_006490 [Culex pipiens pipiens]|uniref:Uncharacterized protein n=1 Tax=Culex pipiens pipiens TaxID=38569 RepID=A0ABD1DPK7_CULPP
MAKASTIMSGVREPRSRSRKLWELGKPANTLTFKPQPPTTACSTIIVKVTPRRKRSCQAVLVEVLVVKQLNKAVMLKGRRVRTTRSTGCHIRSDSFSFISSSQPAENPIVSLFGEKKKVSGAAVFGENRRKNEVAAAKKWCKRSATFGRIRES